MGDQIKQTFGKLSEHWKGLSPKIRKLLTIGLVAAVIAAVGITVFLNASGNGYTVLFPQMEAEESQEVFNMLQDMSIDAQMNSKGEVLVKKSDQDYATAQMAIKHYPKTTLPYDIFNGSNGLTTTDFEKRQLLVQQGQNRLQDTIRQIEGVKNAVVTLNVAESSDRVWEQKKEKSTGSVTVTLDPGVTLTKEQVSGIKYLVSSSAGIAIQDVKVIDAATSLNLKSTEDTLDGDGGSLDFEKQVEERLVEKAMNVLSIAYGPDDVRVAATVVIDYKKMLSEKKTYSPNDTNGNTGVLQHSDDTYTKESAGGGEGVVGENENTDVPPTYLNADGTLNQDAISGSSSRDYLVSYITEQINNDKARLEEASMAIALKNPIDEESKQAMLSNIAAATNISQERISIETLLVPAASQPDSKPTSTNPTFDLKLLIPIAVGVGVLLILLLVLVLVLRSRAKKKHEAEAHAEERALEEARINMQKEFEERKRQLKETAENNSKGDAIANEVRDFARTNPEITANLLRVWLKEEGE